jgi:hypothetical protein
MELFHLFFFYNFFFLHIIFKCAPLSEARVALWCNAPRLPVVQEGRNDRFSKVFWDQFAFIFSL